MKARRLIPTAALAAVITCAAAASASAATTNSNPATTANWSGYVAGATAGSATQSFSKVSGSWVEPSASCNTGQGDAAFWVGLGGAGQQSQALEQVGTEADCAGGTASHFAWYELVPAAPVRLNLTISPGDHVSGNVSVNGSSVTVALSDRTSGASATKTLSMSDPDVASAEWIAEAPSACDGSGSCQPLSLTDFGTVSFSNATATANGHTGPISDPSWTTQPVQLSSSGAGDGGGLVSDTASPGAAPSDLSPDGSSFSVAWVSAASQFAGSGTSGSAGGSPGDGTGYGYGSGSAYGDGSGYDSGSAYGDGSGYGGSSAYGSGYDGYGYGYGGA